MATMSAGKKFPNGYNIDATPEIKRLHSAIVSCVNDWLVCSWFLQRRERCAKWRIIEWDAFCAASVRDYYRPLRDFPLLAANHWVCKETR